MILAKLCWDIFEKAIADYHKLDSVDQPFINPHGDKGLESVLYHKCWIDTVQWHFEDIVRDPKITDAKIAEFKRRIDKSNQDRTDKVEQLDDAIIIHYKDVNPTKDSTLNTESPAWVIDRMSILGLKIYHMREQVQRTDADKDHIQKCQTKLETLLDQKTDLSKSFDEFMNDISQGKKRVKVYRQMKMYNDEKLNPVLYKK